MPEPRMFSIVSAEEASRTPYPYVQVDEDGTVRELHSYERKHLETLFSPYDGARPYVKSSYRSKTPSGSIRGFCPRSQIPGGLVVRKEPDKIPTPMSKADMLAALKSRLTGFELSKNSDGNDIFKRVKKE